MKRRFTFAFCFSLTLPLVLLLSAGSVRGEEAARVESSLVLPDPVWVGQKLTLHVELMGVGQFSGTPLFDLPDPPGLLILKMEERPVLGTKTVEGVTYTSQRHEFSLFAQRPGERSIPAFSVRFGVKAAFDAERVEYTLNTSAHRFEAALPPGAEKLNSLISARNLTLQESWAPEPAEEAELGQAFTRILTFSAPDVPAMAFPPLPVIEVPGLGIYPRSPVVKDQAERGDFKGERVDSVTYVCEQPGEVSLPALVFHWWDLDRKELKTIELPALRWTVAQGAESEAGALAEPESRNAWFIGWVIALHCIGITCFRFRKQLRSFYTGWRTRCAEREAAYFKRLLKACDRNEPARAYPALRAWLDKRYARAQSVTITKFIDINPDPVLERDLHALESALIGRGTTWNGASLRKCLSSLKPGPATHASSPRSLPALNPTHDGS